MKQEVLDELVESIRKKIGPHAQRSTRLFFEIGREMHRYKKTHGYSGSMRELGFEIGKALGLDDYGGEYFDYAARCHVRFSTDQKRILIGKGVCVTDIRALAAMSDRDGWVDNIRTGKLTAPYRIAATYNKRRAKKQKKIGGTRGTTAPDEMPDLPDEVDDERILMILENVASRYGPKRVERLWPMAMERVAKRSSNYLVGELA